MVARSKATATRSGASIARSRTTAARAKCAAAGSTAASKQVRVERTATIEYFDFVLEGRRLDAQHIEIQVNRSPAGRLQAPVRTTVPEREAGDLHHSFRPPLT